MNLVEQAINTHKAIHGTEPKFEPYRGASDHPFEGIDPSLMQDLVNATEVRSAQRKFKINLNKTHKSEGDLKVGDFVHAKRANAYTETIKVGRIFFIDKGYYGVVNFNSINHSFLSVRLCTHDLLKKRAPAPGERDSWDEAIKNSQPRIRTKLETVEWKHVRGDSANNPAKYKHRDDPTNKYLWIEHIYDGNILKVRTNRNQVRGSYSPDKWIFAGKVQIAKQPSSTAGDK